MAIGTFPGMLQEGDHASRPAASAVGSGALYACSDHSLIYQSDGSAWSTWATLSGGGGVTHTYVGYNTVGGSWLAPMISTRNYIKRITLASAGTLVSVGAHIRANRDDLSPLYAGVWADSASAPTDFLAGGDLNELVVGNSTSGFPDPGYWVQVPVGVYLPAGSYWIGVRCHDGSAVSFDLAYDTDATDSYFPVPASGNFHIHANHASVTVTAATNQRWSIRASVLS